MVTTHGSDLGGNVTPPPDLASTDSAQEPLSLSRTSRLGRHTHKLRDTAQPGTPHTDLALTGPAQDSPLTVGSARLGTPTVQRTVTVLPIDHGNAKRDLLY